jgi:hypothetical protein
MKRAFSGPAVALLYPLYVVSQTLLLKPSGAILQSMIVVLMTLTLLNLFGRHRSQWRATFDRPQVCAIVLSIVLVYGPFAEPGDLLIVLVKLGYALAAISLLDSPSGVRTLIRAADWSLAAVVTVVTAAEIGLIPTMTSDFEWDGLIKNYAGFTNPNAPMLFVFSSMALYFLLARSRRLLAAAAVALLLYQVGAVSRTYLGACVLLVSVAVLLHRPAVGWVLRRSLFPLFFLLYVTGSVFIFLAATAPTVLGNLIGTTVDIFLSLRVETALVYLYEPGNTLTGMRFAALDSMYFELVLIFGPVFWFLLLRGAYRCWRAPHHNGIALRLLTIVTIASATGLLETLLLSLTLISLIVFFVATGRRSAFSVAAAAIANSSPLTRHRPASDASCQGRVESPGQLQSL